MKIAGRAGPSVAAVLLENVLKTDTGLGKNQSGGEKLEDARNIAGVAYAG